MPISLLTRILKFENIRELKSRAYLKQYKFPIYE